MVPRGAPEVLKWSPIMSKWKHEPPNWQPQKGPAAEGVALKITCHYHAVYLLNKTPSPFTLGNKPNRHPSNKCRGPQPKSDTCPHHYKNQEMFLSLFRFWRWMPRSRLERIRTRKNLFQVLCLPFRALDHKEHFVAEDHYLDTRMLDVKKMQSSKWLIFHCEQFVMPFVCL